MSQKRDLFFYVERARKRSGVTSDRKLCALLNVSPNTINSYKKGVLPTDETMVKLAQIAGLEPWRALLDLQSWRTANDPETNKVWNKLIQMVGKASLVLGTITAMSSAAHAADFNGKLSEHLNDNNSASIHYHI